MDACPSCHNRYKYICDCDIEVMTCKNDHSWYYNRDEEKVKLILDPKDDPHGQESDNVSSEEEEIQASCEL